MLKASSILTSMASTSHRWRLTSPQYVISSFTLPKIYLKFGFDKIVIYATRGEFFPSCMLNIVQICVENTFMYYSAIILILSAGM